MLPKTSDVKTIPIDDVHIDPANARTHPERNKATIRASLARFGPGRSIVLDSNNVVRAGNGTIEEARQAGFDEVLIVEPGPNQLVAVKRADWSATEAAAYGIADNRAAEHADWDDSALAKTLKALQDEAFDLGAVGYTADELEDLLSDLADEAESPPPEDPGPQIDRADELQKKWGTATGQLWLIPSKTASGEHRLLCGDSTKPDDVARACGGQVQMCVSSPPYWGLRDYGTATWEGGDPECDHRRNVAFSDKAMAKSTIGAHSNTGHAQEPYRDTCGKCGAIRIDSQLGLEATPEAYTARMVALFALVQSVLRDDGTAWVNLGDSYNGSSSSGGKNSLSGGGALRPNGRSQVSNDSLVRDCPGLKPKDMCGIPWRVAFALQADGWYLRSDIIWCLSGGTRLYARTQKGEMPATIHDLVRLDPSTVQLWNGIKWTQVLGWSESPERGEPLEILLRSGERIACTPGHVWPTQRGNVRADELRAGDVIQSATLPDPARSASPECLPDDMVGWFVGLYIAEGSMDTTGTIQISGHTKEIERLARLEQLALAYHGTCRIHVHGENSCSICLDSSILRGILESYVAGKTAKGKHLTTRAWQRSRAFLESVLKGYLSGDGHWDSENQRWRLGFTDNEAWAADLRTITARVGVSLRLNKCSHSMNGKSFPGHKGEIRFTRSGHGNCRQDAEVMEINRSNGRSFWDIGVADEPHLFSLASGVLTHNSKPNPMPESVTDRPTKAHEYVFLLSKRERYFWDAEAIAEPATPGEYVTTGKSGSNYQAIGMGREPSGNGKPGAHWSTGNTRNIRTVWTITPQPFKEAHFATFPVELAARCIAAGTSERGACPTCGAAWERVTERQEGDVLTWKQSNGATEKHAGRITQGLSSTKSGFNKGSKADYYANMPHNDTLGWRPTCKCPSADPVPCTCFDPFMGAATTIVACEQLGRLGRGIELSPQYVAIALERLAGMGLSPVLSNQAMNVDKIACG